MWHNPAVESHRYSVERVSSPCSFFFFTEGDRRISCTMESTKPAVCIKQPFLWRPTVILHRLPFLENSAHLPGVLTEQTALYIKLSKLRQIAQIPGSLLWTLVFLCATPEEPCESQLRLTGYTLCVTVYRGRLDKVSWDENACVAKCRVAAAALLPLLWFKPSVLQKQTQSPSEYHYREIHTVSGGE